MNTVKIPLGRNAKDGYALIDESDSWVLEHRWYKSNNGYIKSSGGKHYLHRLIMSTPTGVQVDHINNDRADNRRANLRHCNQSENNANSLLRTDNTSGVRGVSWDRFREKWVAQVWKNRKIIFRKRFDTKEEAIKAYRLNKERLYGEFARH